MNKRLDESIQRGHGRADRPVTRELWALDAQPEHVIVRENGEFDPNNRKIDYRRYYDPEYARAEMETVWTKQWLYAAREEDFASVGDRLPFNLGSLSFIISRHGEDEYKAFYNSCLHRGAMLCTEHASGKIKCPYHGWEWNPDGSLSRIPAHWDFTDCTRLNTGLREVKLERWGGCIFINCDPDSKPLSDWLGLLPAHFECYEPENRYTAVHFKKLMKANWKINQEAFQESYHLTTTHPEAVPFNTDSQAQYDVYETPMGAIGRTSTPGCNPSMEADETASMYTATLAFIQIMQTWHYPDAQPLELDPEGDVRAQAAAWVRKVYEQTYGKQTTAPDTVLLDSLLYFVFPNFCMWLSEAVPLLYRFLPHESDPEMSYFEVRVLRPCPEGQPRPAPSPCVHVGADESLLELVDGLNFLGMVFSQDTSNMPLVQRGVRTADPGRAHTSLGRYQEALIQHWNSILDQLIPPSP